ncbi:UDP-N-acetylmuramoyl-tripeptide--D-alanyl-D-alanine ligase [bacterium]|nr:UDP-N-acetylmuramoyl-tripeptide--D-alanyl-D-alanine ligase [candidate division CSSED10-310 bacterium]
MKMDWDVIIRSMLGKLYGTPTTGFNGAATDSRTIKPGELYFALAGERFDGHDYAAAAISKGAAAAVTARGKCVDVQPRIEVDDPLSAMQALAGYARSRVDIPVIAITGSHGKTTTKDILAAIMSQNRRTLATYQNLNGLIGVPLTLLQLDETHKTLVIEVGVSVPGEMKKLASIVKPTHAIFTCVAPAHSQFMPTLKAIIDEKKQLFEHLKPGGKAILNADDPMIMRDCQISEGVTFGLDSGDYRARILVSEPRGTEFEVLGPFEYRTTFNIPCHGRHNIYNALGAVCAAHLIGVPDHFIQTGMDTFILSPHRSQIIKLDERTVIDDTYNAAPSSMRCAFRLLAEYPAHGRRIAILGDMLELGEGSVEAHKRLGISIADFGIDMLIAFGPEMLYAVEEATRRGVICHYFTDNRHTANAVADLLKTGDVILVKASRSMHAEMIVEHLVN